ncbi:trypsin [Reticulomyxa filosa]|uniref:Trypsin n=1 Tax=Reticulomyxa filosa TaxID=46433 RepID=X6MH40_RETFI|nr:trypsin [Reticulomyxa filosa]|eukprot:ETO12956.1 trypsin [Reticulomyxa filosa]
MQIQMQMQRQIDDKTNALNIKQSPAALSEATTSPAIEPVLSVTSVDVDVDAITDITLNGGHGNHSNSNENENEAKTENVLSEKEDSLSSSSPLLMEEKEVRTSKHFNLTKLLRRSLQVTNTPTYLIYGGIVFIPLSRPYLRSYYGHQWSTKCPLQLALLADESKEEVNDQVIIVSHVLAHAVNIGYEGYYMRQLLSVNNQQVHNIIELMLILEESTARKDSFIRFGLWQTIVMVLECDKALDSLSEVLRMHNIPNDKSEDLMFIKEHIGTQEKEQIFAAMKAREEQKKANQKTSTS